MRTYFILLCVIVQVVSYSSCTVEKRVYNKGYQITHYSGGAKKRKNEIIAMPRMQQFGNQAHTAILNNSFDNASASKNKKDVVNEHNLRKPLPNRFDCDSLVLKDGTSKAITLIAYNDSLVQYTTCQTTSEIKQISPGEIHYLVLKTGEKLSFIPFQYTDRATVYYEAKSYFTKKEKLHKNFALASFGLSIGSIILAVFLFVLLSLWPALIVFAVLAILAIILGAIALSNSRKNPNLRKFSIYAILGIVFSSLLLIASITLLTGVALKWF